MDMGQKRHTRKLGKRQYKKLFVIASEGFVTESQYFDLFSNHTLIKVERINRKTDNSPRKILQRMSEYLKENSLRKNDEAWLVVDRDSWEESHIDELYHWSNQDSRFDLALSNPQFEYWLLLHFEDGTKASTKDECLRKLKRYLPKYQKNNIDPKDFPESAIRQAIERAKKRDTPPCKDWPRTPGNTTVYRLVDNILNTK